MLSRIITYFCLISLVSLTSCRTYNGDDDSDNVEPKTSRYDCHSESAPEEAVSLVLVETPLETKGVFDFHGEDTVSGACGSQPKIGFSCISTDGGIKIQWQEQIPGASESVTVTRKRLFGTLGTRSFAARCKKLP